MTRIPQIEAEVAKLLAEAEAIDAAEDAEFGADRRGDELPAELQTREGRLAKMREAEAAIEAEAAERAAAKAADKARHQEHSTRHPPRPLPPSAQPIQTHGPRPT